MLIRSFARSACWSSPPALLRVGRRIPPPPPLSAKTSVARVFATIPPRQRETQSQNPTQSPQQKPVPENVKSAGQNAKKLPGQVKPDVLLAEQLHTRAEQRKADWAIMKEMSRYLWPKVSASHTTNIGILCCSNALRRTVWVRGFAWACPSLCSSEQRYSMYKYPSISRVL